MIIYLEKKAKKYSLVWRILKKIKNSQIIEIDNYKNIFDKNTWIFPAQKSIIIAKLNWNTIFKAPENYWPTNESYFIKTSLNCIFNCSYCYLKWMFINNFIVIFVNYNDIKKQIKSKIYDLRKSWIKNQICFYVSNYSDTQGLDYLTEFNKNFINFFEKFDNVIFESRTKSDKIEDLLKLKSIPKNFEISFSLNPEEIIKKYEKWASSLDMRIKSINSLIKKWFKVWLRFIPFLPVQNWEKLYCAFFDKIKFQIDLNKIHSISVWGLMYPEKDLNKIVKRSKDFDFEKYFLDKEDWFLKFDKKEREKFKKICIKYFKKFSVCLD